VGRRRGGGVAARRGGIAGALRGSNHAAIDPAGRRERVAGGIGVMCLSALLVAFALLRTTPDSLLSGYRATANPNAELGGDSNE
ncbi:hypothetical protein, partial [Haladaptatus sp. R4]|uniref:hypothetical protein n=1 Tax=Haladaptatus sp. R4 TaxID=1679489 RepID=UPI000A54CE40